MVVGHPLPRITLTDMTCLPGVEQMNTFSKYLQVVLQRRASTWPVVSDAFQPLAVGVVWRLISLCPLFSLSDDFGSHMTFQFFF